MGLHASFTRFEHKWRYATLVTIGEIRVKRKTMFVCFKGVIEVPGLTPVPPLPPCPMDVSIFAEFPNSLEPPLHHRNSGLRADNKRQM